MAKVTDRLREIYNETAAHYDAVVGRARAPHFLTLARMMDFEGKEHVADLGCGPGSLAPELLRHVKRVSGLDASPAMVDVAQKRFPTEEWRVGSATATGWPETHFDAVVSSQLLPWLPDPAAFLEEVHRILKPGRRFGLITAAGNTYREFFQALEKLLRTYEEYYQTDSVNQVWGSHTYTTAQLTTLLQGARFRVQDWVILQTEVATTPEDYLELMRMFTNDHYLYPIPEEYRAAAKAKLTDYLRREGLTLNERAIVMVARRA